MASAEGEDGGIVAHAQLTAAAQREYNTILAMSGVVALRTIFEEEGFALRVVGGVVSGVRRTLRYFYAVVKTPHYFHRVHIHAHCVALFVWEPSLDRWTLAAHLAFRAISVLHA